MLQSLYNLGSNITFLLAIVCFFATATLFWLIISRWAEEFLQQYKDTFTSTASTNMADMFMFVDPNRLFLLNLVAIIVFPLLTWLVFRDLPSTLAILVIVLILPTFFYRSMRNKRLKRFEEQLPDGLTMISGAMRAGASLSIAMEGLVKEMPPPLSQEFELFIKEQRLGVEFEDSMKKMEERLPLQDFSMLVTALRINREVGGNLAETMESLADTLRRKASMEGKIESLTAQGKLQGVVMTGLPVLLGFLLNLMEPEAMSKLWTTTVGWIVLAVVIVMEVMGYVMIKKITTIDV